MTKQNPLKKRTNYLILIFLVFLVSNSFSQEDTSFKRSGNIYGDLFLNGNYNMSQGYASFRLNRLHFGYKYNLSEHLYFNGMIEAALEDYAPNADSTNYNGITNLFEFCLGFKFEKIEGKFGLIGTEFNQQQEKLWQHRYVDKVFADKYGLAPTNDFGVLAIYKVHDMFKFDVAITNGEGHKSLQADSVFRVAAGATFNLSETYIARVYTDFMSIAEVMQTNIIGILGYTSDMVTVGVEWNQQNNSDGQDGYQKNGFSGYATGNLNKNYQLFARYDLLSSNQPSGFTDNSNLFNDGSLILAGVQYKLMDGVVFALDYRNWTPADSNSDTQSFIFFDIALNF